MVTEIKTALDYWLELQVYVKVVKYKNPEISLHLFTYASPLGWGFHTNQGIQDAGSWPSKLRKADTVYIKELVRIYYALLKIQPNRGVSILGHCDNNPAVGCVSNGETTQSPTLWNWSFTMAARAYGCRAAVPPDTHCQAYDSFRETAE